MKTSPTGIAVHRRLGWFGALALASVAACDYAYEFRYRVTVSEDVDLSVFESGTEVIMATSLDDDVALALDHVRRESLDGDAREFGGDDETCCASPNREYFLFAFIDADGDGTWTEGEPWGADPNSPVVIDDDGYVSEIEIGPAVAPD